MPSPLRNGDLRSPAAVHRQIPFQSTVSEQKIRRLNALILLLRFAAFCFTLAAAVFMASNSSRSQGSPSWIHYPSFRYVLAANSIVAIYSVFETCAAAWEFLKAETLLPESLQLWFDFSHDQSRGMHTRCLLICCWPQRRQEQVRPEGFVAAVRAMRPARSASRLTSPSRSASPASHSSPSQLFSPASASRASSSLAPAFTSKIRKKHH